MDQFTIDLYIQTHIQDSHHQHWHPSGLRSLPTALLPLHQWLHFKGPLSQDLKWDNHIDSIAKKAQQRLYFLRQLRKFNLPQELLKQFYTAIIVSVPVFFYNCLVWFSYQNKHQKTTTDSQDCWEDYRCPSAQSPRTLHLQSEEKV